MKAALLVQPGRIVLDDVVDPTVRPGEVEIAVGGVGLCGSDLSVFSGSWPAPIYPWVMGHEAFGTVVAIGRGVPSERVGQMVVVEPNLACLACAQCLRGRTSACQARQSVGMNRAGALAERLVVPDAYAWPISGEPEDLVCVEPTAVVETSLRRLGMPLPASALVVGVGAQGLLMTLALQARGVSVGVHDVNAQRVALAVSLGARAIEAGDEDAMYDLVIDTVGSPSSTDTAIGRLEIGGTLLLLGLDGRPIGIAAQTIVRRQLVLRGSLTYDHPHDFASAVALVGKADLSPGRIVTEEHDLDDVQVAFERAPAAAGKTWIRVGKQPEGS